MLKILSKNDHERYESFLLNYKKEGFDLILDKNPFLKAIANILPSAIYVLDFVRDEYLYVGENCTRIFGYTREEYMSQGRELFLSHAHPDDVNIYLSKVIEHSGSVMNEISKEDLPLCRFSVLFRSKNKDGVYLKILQQYVVLEVTDEKMPMFSLGVVTDLTNHVNNEKFVFNITKYKNGVGTILYDFEKTLHILPDITARENQVLQLLVQGNTTKQIAEILHLSNFTVSAHRRNLLAKTESKNTFELVEFAIKTGLMR